MTEDEMKFGFRRWLVKWLAAILIAVVGAYLYRWKPYVGIGYLIYILKEMHGITK